MALDNFTFMMPDDNDEFDSDGNKIYKPLLVVYKDDKPASGGKKSINDYETLRFDLETELKIIAADKRKRSAQKISPFPAIPPSVYSGGKRGLRGAGYSAGSKIRKCGTSSPNISSTKRFKQNMTGTGSKAKKNLFSLYDEYKPKSSVVRKIKTCNSGEHQEPTLLPDSEGNSSSLFEQDEIECGILPNAPAPLSPLSSLTSKLKNTKISEDHIRFDINRLTHQVKQSLKSYEAKYERDVKRMQEIQERIELDKDNFIAQMTKKMKEVDQLKNHLSNKENRTVRLASPGRTTPKSASQNLRIATLNKNMQRSAKKGANPDRKMEKAVSYYNTIRSSYGVLSTPKMKRNELMDRGASMDDTISLKLQRQCLMLVDTPVHN